MFKHLKLKVKNYRDSIIWFLLSLILLFTLSFLFISSPPHSDEKHFIETIKIFTERNLFFTMKDYPEITPPLFYIVFSLWSKIFGFSTESLRILNLFISLVCWQLIFYFFKVTTYRPKSSFLLSALVILNPYLLGVSIFVYNDNLMLLFLLLAMIFLYKDRTTLTGVSLSLALLIRQYSIIFPLSVFIYSSLKSIKEKKLRTELFTASVLSIIPLLMLFIYWKGFAPESGLKVWYVKNRSIYNLDYINTYLTLSSVYILPLLIYFFYKRGFVKSKLIFAIAFSIIVSFFPIKPSLATLGQINVTTVGYAHKFSNIIFGADSTALNILFFIFLIAGSYITITLFNDFIKKYREDNIDEESILSLCWLLFLLIMPFSFQVWEKYLLMILTFYMAAIYKQATQINLNHKS